MWGTQHSIIKLAVDSAHSTPASLNCARFFLAALVSAPFLPPLPRLSRLPLVWTRGLEQAAWMFAGYAAQAVALQTTTAARSGFLLYLNVKLVPLLARILYGRRIAPSVWASAALALAGTVLLTYDGSPPVVGDLWSVAAAAASAMFIVRMERAAAVAEPSAVSAVAVAGVAGLSGVWAVLDAVWAAPGTGGLELVKQVVDGIVPDSPETLAGVLYLGLVTTALSNYLQTVGQKRIPAEKAAVLYALDPVYGAMFAYLLLGESLGMQGIAGAILVTIAAIWSNQSGLQEPVKSHVEDEENGTLLRKADFEALDVGEEGESGPRKESESSRLDWRERLRDAKEPNHAGK